MTIDRDNLPDEVPALKSIIYHLLDIIDAQKKIIEEQRQQIAHLTARVESLERRLYGHRSERQRKSSSSKKNKDDSEAHGRRILPKDLPRQQLNYELSGNMCVCKECGAFLSKIGDIVSEQLECLPTQLYVIEHRRAKYACKKCQGSVVSAPMPLQPIDKGLPGPGLLAEVLVNKYEDHLPLYRQSQRFKRAGFILPRSTLCDWFLASAQLLSPLVKRIEEKHLKASNHLFTDDTPIRVLRGVEGQGKTGRFWVYINKGNVNNPACTIYHFTAGRHGKEPQGFLKDFKGYLQADAYAGYDKVYAANESTVKESGCWSHVRRRFFDIAQISAPNSLAHEALAFIGRLYHIEKQAREKKLDIAATKQWRQEHAPPVLEEFKSWLLIQKERVLPKSSLAEAIGYTLNHWQALNSYLEEGYLEIDNNRAEREIRPLVVGRKNYLFAGSNKGGESAAIIYSLLETCKQHKVNSWFYLKDVLTRISTHPYSKIDELLPYYWQPSLHLTDRPVFVEAA